MSLELERRPWSGTRWRGLGAFLATELRVQLHEGLAIASSIIVQVVFLVFVGILATQFLPYVLVGAVVFSTFQIGQRLQNEAAYVRIDHKLNELYHASSMSPESYYLGMSIGVFLAYLPPILILYGVTLYLVHFTAGAALFFAAVLGLVWLFTASVGYVFSTWHRDMRLIWPYASIFFNLFGVLPPVFYPIWIFPAGLRTLALALPTSGGAALVESVAGIYPLNASDTLIAGASLVASAAALFWLALVWARRTARER